MDNATVLKRGDHTDHQQISTANCYFFEPLLLEDHLSLCTLMGGMTASRLAIIEVPDTPASLHFHLGLTLAIVMDGQGIFKTKDANYPIKKGDILVIPPYSLHASQADPGTLLVEYSVFIGYPEDFEAIEVLPDQ